VLQTNATPSHLVFRIYELISDLIHLVCRHSVDCFGWDRSVAKPTY